MSRVYVNYTIFPLSPIQFHRLPLHLTHRLIKIFATPAADIRSAQATPTATVAVSKQMHEDRPPFRNRICLWMLLFMLLSIIESFIFINLSCPPRNKLNYKHITNALNIFYFQKNKKSVFFFYRARK